MSDICPKFRVLWDLGATLVATCCSGRAGLRSSQRSSSEKKAAEEAKSEKIADGRGDGDAVVVVILSSG
jgi:hypothetical protein